MTDSFPRQYARTQRFTLGVPRSFQISPDGETVAFLRSKGGDDPVTCLWVLDVGTGTERLVVDPGQIGAPGLALDPEEKARRERSREQAAGAVGARELPARSPAADPRPDPAGKLVAYVCAGALRVVDTGTGDDRAIA